MSSWPSPLRRLASPLLAIAALMPCASAWADAELELFIYGPNPNVSSFNGAASVSNSLNGTPGFSAGQASGYANLDTGTLGVAVEGTYLANSYPAYNLAQAQASLYDVLTFQGPGSTVTATMSLHVDGNFVMSGSGAGIATKAFAELSLGSYDTATLNVNRYYNPGSGTDTVTSSTNNGAPGSFVNATLDSVTGLLVLTETLPTNTAIGFSTVFEIYTTPGASTMFASGDFSHTAQLALALPDGYSFTSASGHFLTAAAVPEPASEALMLAGLAALGIGAWRRQPKR
jgi:hypothetical protein